MFGAEFSRLIALDNAAQMEAPRIAAMLEISERSVYRVLAA